MSINLIDYPIAVQAWSGCHLLWKITLYTGKIWDYLEERVANFPKNPNEISRGHNDNREEWTMSQGHLAFLFQVFGFILYGDCNVAWPHILSCFTRFSFVRKRTVHTQMKILSLSTPLHFCHVKQITFFILQNSKVFQTTLEPIDSQTEITIVC